MRNDLAVNQSDADVLIGFIGLNWDGSIKLRQVYLNWDAGRVFVWHSYSVDHKMKKHTFLKAVCGWIEF